METNQLVKTHLFLYGWEDPISPEKFEPTTYRLPKKRSYMIMFENTGNFPVFVYLAEDGDNSPPNKDDMIHLSPGISKHVDLSTGAKNQTQVKLLAVSDEALSPLAYELIEIITD